MRLLLVFFPNPNAGDYLIEERTIKLFQQSFCNDYIEVVDGLNETQKIDPDKFDSIVFGGGPFFDDRVMDTMIIPYFGDITSISIPVHIVGSGIYGSDCSDYGLYERSFSENTMKFYRLMDNNNGSFGCRDELSYYIMKNTGLNNVYLTGCPAWYDLNFINNLVLHYRGSIKRVVISNPGVTKQSEEQENRAKQCIDVIRFIKETFKNAALLFTFNAGIKTKYSGVCNSIVLDYLEREGIPYIDMCSNAKMFSEYDKCDLHIGYRVHSHIYCLSHGIPSILIEEDVRGYGINETLCLPHILSYDSKEMNQNSKYKPNPFLLSHLSNRLQVELETSFFRYNGTLMIITEMYKKQWKNWIEMIRR